MTTTTHPISTPSTQPQPLDLTQIQPGITALQHLEAELSRGLIERQDAIHTALLAMAAREHLILVGPPGTAKSQLVNLLVRQITTLQGDGLPSFSWLMTKFTTPEDVFGPISLEGLKQDRYVRVTRGRLPAAKFAFLDEILRGSDPLLETLLTVMNEREYDNDGQRSPIPLLSLFGATNTVNVPSSPEGKIGAVWDRFLFRVTVDYVSESNFVSLLRLPTPVLTTKVVETDLLQVQQAVPQVGIPDLIYEHLYHLRRALADKQILVSDRRWMQAITALQASALLAGRGLVDSSDLRVLRHVFWQKPEQRTEVLRAILSLVAPYESDILEKLDLARSVMHTLEVTRQRQQSAEEELKAAMEAMGKLRVGVRDLEQVRQQLLLQALPMQSLEQAMSEVKQMITTVSEMIVSPAS